MTTYAEYKAAQETVNSYRGIALKRVEDYVRSGKSPFGAINVGDFKHTDNPAEVYRLDFSMEIGVRPDNTVLVWANPWDDGESTTAYIPLDVLDGKFV